jgi:hypothetical protein
LTDSKFNYPNSVLTSILTSIITNNNKQARINALLRACFIVWVNTHSLCRCFRK